MTGVQTCALPIFEEISAITEITALPLENNIQVKWRNTVTKDGEVISAKDHYRLYPSDQKDQFITDVGTDADKYIAAIGWA